MDLKKDEFGTLAVCAVRYAIGRMTYMPDLVMHILIPRIPEMKTNDLIPIVNACRAPWNTKETTREWASFCAMVEAELAARGVHV